MRYHKAHLTRRLILDTSADNEKEENMVEWLRVSYVRLSVTHQLILDMSVDNGKHGRMAEGKSRPSVLQGWLIALLIYRLSRYIGTFLVSRRIS